MSVELAAILIVSTIWTAADAVLNQSKRFVRFAFWLTLVAAILFSVKEFV